MLLRPSAFTTLLLILCISCGESPKKNTDKVEEKIAKTDTLPKTENDPSPEEPEEEQAFVLTEENAIDFFFNYAKELKKNKVKLTTNMGSFTLELYDDVPYHKANFIYLARKNYFDSTQFHRVVKDFIIQGGNSDDRKTSKKRADIGRYLLPPDTKKGHKHHRGTISMPSSERDNPHKLASPYEFFIVVTDPGSYHLDGSYTPFGRVIEGMDVVDAINKVPVGDGDWPWKSVYILKAEVL
ncbi:Peptidyl-prolyl cis-trans isomerase (rotamase)-cyclophilin family [Flagellimonas taeanensis]|uniref:Peptidyl-prolyl cis-trans isomerase n=1 Tax=Flagellimonas taeanensis TaxID=1005926 RepID=A0A1M7CC12_9FLAO|nr:peptidylprolyl isomerase [Allomuricauda taeanensis]MEE1964517.1 peptidylprolyl isomerase [Allomuricauda taeanensis]SFC61795.1 Peptidyl-prolyl cis-trans isomerase (rotamase)-cyclophilin family [Allomuricauda taeanensis]SHL64723.1 Peptidyl-prolyl cis-trans isomerase (rotamase)-cyclophilin family [Allomuricauda taeanensis]